tara:strand:+ start:97 stop:339 length:243 start_codon:yes stop_codon:yes gene_type:complete
MQDQSPSTLQEIIHYRSKFVDLKKPRQPIVFVHPPNLTISLLAIRQIFASKASIKKHETYYVIDYISKVSPIDMLISQSS